MRIIGGGFVALTFDSEFTCQKARDQSIAENRGAQRGYPPLNEWTVLTGGDGQTGGMYARLASGGDQVERCPI